MFCGREAVKKCISVERNHWTIASMRKRLQELIVMDNSKQPLTFTLWEDAIIEDEGTRLLAEFPAHPIIFARRVGVSKYNGTSLTTRFNTTIQISPPYAECTALQSWVTANAAMLKSFAVRSTSASGSLISAPVEERTILIANIHAQQDGQTFTIEARITPPTTFSCCYVLACPTCKQEVRNLRKRTFHCTGCDEQNMLIPRCRFEATLTDASGSTKGTIMDEQASALLSLTAEEIYAKAHSQWDDAEQPKIPNRPFRIQVKKAFPRGTQQGSPRVFIVAINRDENTTPQPAPAITSNIPSQHKKSRYATSSPQEEPENQKKASTILKLKEKMEPPTPTKKQ